MHERDVVQPLCAAPLFGDGKGRGIGVHANDGSRRSDQLTDQEAHVAHTAAHVEHLHAGANSSRSEDALGGWAKRLGLLRKTTELLDGSPERVVGIRAADGHHHCVGMLHANDELAACLPDWASPASRCRLLSATAYCVREPRVCTQEDIEGIDLVVAELREGIPGYPVHDPDIARPSTGSPVRSRCRKARRP